MNRVKLSKTLSYILRHHPEDFGLKLDSEGYINVQNLIQALKARFPQITYAAIKEVVAKDGKGRFSLDSDEKKIKANYGHSISGITPSYTKVVPPVFLYHGTARRFVKSILKEGIKPMGRNFVHLSETIDDALKVGKRRDPKPVVLRIKALDAHEQGTAFYRTGKGIYLARVIPSKYLEINLLK